MTIKPRYRKMASKEHEGYDLFVSLRLPASDMSDLLQAAAIGWNRIAERCPTEGFPADEPYWRAKAAEANEAAFLIDEEIKSGKLDRKMIEKKAPA